MKPSLSETMTSRNDTLLRECEHRMVWYGGVRVDKIVNKLLQFLWTFSPDHENIVDKSSPYIWLVFKFTKK